jgi:hypothetical protein
MRAIVLCLALGLVAMVVLACQQRPAAVAPTGVTNFEARASGFSPSPADQCDGKADACTRIKFVVTNVGDQEGDTMCTVRMINARVNRSTPTCSSPATLPPASPQAGWVISLEGQPQSGVSALPTMQARSQASVDRLCPSGPARCYGPSAGRQLPRPVPGVHGRPQSELGAELDERYKMLFKPASRVPSVNS